MALLLIYTVLSDNVSDVVCDFAGDYCFTYVAFRLGLIQFSKVETGLQVYGYLGNCIYFCI